jgi:hypothetical protein
MHEKGKILAVLARYNDAFAATKPLSENAMEIYVEALCDIPADVVGAAMKKIVLTSRFFPTVAEIREAVEGLTRHANGNDLPTPEEAWAEVFRLAKGYSVSDEWPYSCTEIREAVRRFGGKIALAMMDNVSVTRAQFQRCYSGVLESHRDREANEAVLGPDLSRIGAAARKMLEAGA